MAASDEAAVLKQAQDFLRFYIRGGAAVLQDDLNAVSAAQGDPNALALATADRTQLIQASDAEITAALAAFSASSGPVTGAESTPLATFVASPGIARRIPAVRGPAPDFIPVINTDLTKNSFAQQPPQFGDDAAIAGLFGPLAPAPDPSGGVAPTPQDTYLDMCAVEDAVVTSSSGLFQVSIVWVQDYPVDVESTARVRAVVDQAQPSVIAAECMEALQAFLGQDVFEEFSFTCQIALCSFEQLDTQVATLKAAGS